MLQKNKRCEDENSCFERSERLLREKMDTWRNTSSEANARNRGCRCEDEDPCEDDIRYDLDTADYSTNSCRCRHRDCEDDDAEFDRDRCRCNDRRCRCPEREDNCDCETEDCDDQVLAMAYVKKQCINTRTVKDCDDALGAGTMFDELEKPFTGGDTCD